MNGEDLRMIQGRRFCFLNEPAQSLLVGSYAFSWLEGINKGRRNKI